MTMTAADVRKKAIESLEDFERRKKQFYEEENRRNSMDEGQTGVEQVMELMNDLSEDELQEVIDHANALLDARATDLDNACGG